MDNSNKTADYVPGIEVELQEFMGSDKSIANAAWTSSTEESEKEIKTDADVSRVVNMLADLGHSVPFESVIFRFWIRLPIAINRQHMTHRIASHSGMSGRYRTMPSDFLPIQTDVAEILEKANCLEKTSRFYNEICQNSNSVYNQMLSYFKECQSGGAITNKEYKRLREFLRGILPQHNMTERVTIMNLRAFANYYKLRGAPDAQPEIQLIARKMLDSVVSSNICPIAIEALERNDWII